jgi:hypothetical protein
MRLAQNARMNHAQHSPFAFHSSKGLGV